MPIYEGSRYERSRVVPVADRNGVFRATVLAPAPSGPPTSYTVHRIEDTDRLDLLAEQAYGDPEQWWRIAQANPHLPYPDALPPGEVIRIPTLEDAT